jgi:membrane protease YdiL (CAAX protease family)
VSDSQRRYSITLLTLWLALGAAGAVYARIFEIPAHAAVAVIAACLVEVAFYILPAFLSQPTASPVRVAAVLAISGLPPYLIYAALTGTFSLNGFLLVAALACAVSFWFAVLPKHPVLDVLFLVMMAIVYLSRVFSFAYLPLSEAPKIPVDYLGRLMWIRLGIAAALYLRRAGHIGFGFIPRGNDWKIGFLHYLAFLPIAAALNYAVGFAHLKPMPQDWLKLAVTAVAIFLGMLWVPVLCEEFFFRGLLQHWMEEWTGKPTVALVVTSLLFGSVHLVFPRMSAFPNWRFALLAFFAGLFYGHAYQKGKTIRTAMVTHALVNTTWRVFFG